MSFYRHFYTTFLLLYPPPIGMFGSRSKKIPGNPSRDTWEVEESFLKRLIGVAFSSGGMRFPCGAYSTKKEKSGLKIRTFLTSLSILVALLCPLTDQAHAAGYAILENSSQGLGNAFAGGVTGYGDASSAFLNPAAMPHLETTTISFGGHLIVPNADFTDSGSTVVGTPNGGTNGPNGGETAFVPNLYAVHPLTDGISLGLYANAPFGLATEFDREWVGRYQAVKSELQVVNLGTSVGIEIDQNFSVGVGVSAVYADAELSNAIDFGSIGFGRLGAEDATTLGLSPQGNDGFGVVEGDDWGFGFNLGALYSFGPGKRNRAGISYRAKTSLDLEGTGKFTVPTEATLLTSGGAFADTDAVAGVTFPEALILGGTYWFNSQWAVLYESQWTRWSRFDELRIEYANAAQPDTVTDTSWGNAWRHSVGVTFVPAQAWELRSGFTFDESPIPSAENRTPRIPDEDRFWLAGGLTYHFNDELSLDVSYAHIFFDDGEVATSGATDSLRGSFDSSVDIVSAGFVWTL